MNIQDLEILYESLKSKQPSSQTRYISYNSLYKTAFMFKSIFKQYNMIDDVSLDEFLLCYPVLALIESLIHEVNIDLGSNQQNNLSWDARKKIIQSFLKEFNLEHPTILNAMENLGEFFHLGSQLVTSETITNQDVIRASELQSSEINMLYFTLISILGKPYKTEVFELMSPINILLEFHDDFRSYQEDRAAGNYNTYWMFQKLYGEEAHHYLKAEIDRYSNLFEATLKRLSEQEQEVYSAKWSRLWQNVFPYFSSAELLRQAVLEGV